MIKTKASSFSSEYDWQWIMVGFIKVYSKLKKTNFRIKYCLKGGFWKWCYEIAAALRKISVTLLYPPPPKVLNTFPEIFLRPKVSVSYEKVLQIELLTFVTNEWCFQELFYPKHCNFSQKCPTRNMHKLWDMSMVYTSSMYNTG